jgi:pyruvate formate lyase activating enzyme
MASRINENSIQVFFDSLLDDEMEKEIIELIIQNLDSEDILKKLLEDNLLDYIAMDIKNSFEKYNLTTNTNVNIEKIKESIGIIENSNIDYEFRTTLYKEAHTTEDIEKILSYIKNKSKFIAQPYKYSKEQLEDIEYTSYADEDLELLKNKYNILIRI